MNDGATVILNGFREYILSLLPNIVLSIVILIIGYIIGKLTAKAVTGAVRLTGGDEKFRKSDIGKNLTDAGYPISRILSIVTRLAIYTLTVLTALSVLNIPLLQEVGTLIAGYLPRLVGAIIVFLFGAMLIEWIADLTESLIRESVLPERFTTLFTLALKYMMYVVLVFMMFEIAEIAPQIVAIVAQATFLTLAIGGGLSIALLIGLGLREEAKVLLLGELGDLKPGVVVEIEGGKGVIKRITTLLVELEDENGNLIVLPKRMFIQKGYKIIRS